ncbi:hypothetical protein Hanom_Chr15g01365601 [Helianthus anomalus]
MFYDLDLDDFDAFDAAAFTRVVGLIALFGFKAFPILKTAQAVPTACPTALIFS